MWPLMCHSSPIHYLEMSRGSPAVRKGRDGDGDRAGRGGVGYLSATLSLICKHLNTLKNLMTELLAVLTVLILHSHLRKGVSAEKKRE